MPDDIHQAERDRIRGELATLVTGVCGLAVLVVALVGYVVSQ